MEEIHKAFNNFERKDVENEFIQGEAMAKGVQLALIYGFIMPLIIVLLLIVVARSNDDRVKEETRRENQTTKIYDDNEE